MASATQRAWFPWIAWMSPSAFAYSGSAHSDLLTVAGKLAAGRWNSGKFDPAPELAKPAAPVNSGRTAIYGRTLAHPAKTRSINAIIPPIASRIDGVFLLVGRRLVSPSYPLFEDPSVSFVQLRVPVVPSPKVVILSNAKDLLFANSDWMPALQPANSLSVFDSPDGTMARLSRKRADPC